MALGRSSRDANLRSENMRAWVRMEAGLYDNTIGIIDWFVDELESPHG